jgi:DNA polymerase III epsilon subunit-like protein
MNNVLIYDTETTGFPNPKNPVYVTQICFIEYNMGKKRIVNVYNRYITLPDGVLIPELLITKIGITQEMCTNTGTSSIQMLVAFVEAYMRSDTIVAHNLHFDRKMIMHEIERNVEALDILCPAYKCVFNPLYESNNYIINVCTMKQSTVICNLWMRGRCFPNKCSRSGINSGRRRKDPTLGELYKHFFGVAPEVLHNAYDDTLNCMKCFLKLIPLAWEDGGINFTVVGDEEEEVEMVFDELEAKPEPVFPRRSVRIHEQIARNHIQNILISA